MTFLGLSQTFGSVVFSGFFGFVTVVFSDGRWHECPPTDREPLAGTRRGLAEPFLRVLNDLRHGVRHKVIGATSSLAY